MFKRTLLLPIAILTACSFDGSTRLQKGVDARELNVSDARQGLGAADANVDDKVDANVDDKVEPVDSAPADPCVNGQLGFEMLNLESCDANIPTEPLILDIKGSYWLNTETGELEDPNRNRRTLRYRNVVQSDGSVLFVLSMTELFIGPDTFLFLIRSRPVVFVSTTRMQIDGTLSASAFDSVSGAGGNIDVHCLDKGRGNNGETQHGESFRTKADGTLAPGGSGGSGGGFFQQGGDGARVNLSEGSNSQGGAASLGTQLVPLRGGCSGGSGGFSGGVGGGGGGAVQLIAKTEIILNGYISARGHGGKGTSIAGSGGGGGGSGGGILIQSPNFHKGVNAHLSVNGGGGGEGNRARLRRTHQGEDGHNRDDNPAVGGSATVGGGNGGNGGTPTIPAKNGQEGFNKTGKVAGGGGGGGSAGIIVIR